MLRLLQDDFIIKINHVAFDLKQNQQLFCMFSLKILSLSITGSIQKAAHFLYTAMVIVLLQQET